LSESVAAVFFDVGDTLVFDEPSMSSRIVTGLGCTGLEAPEARIQVGIRRAEDFILPMYAEGIDTESPTIRRQALEIICRTAGLQILNDPEWQHFCEVFDRVPFVRTVHPEAHALLEFLSQQGGARALHLGIISDWDPELPSVLRELDILKYFHSLSVSAIVGAHKPFAALFEHALRESNCRPEEALHVGDFYELDYIGAVSAGMNALLFDWRNRMPASNINRVTTFSELAQTLHQTIELGQRT